MSPYRCTWNTVVVLPLLLLPASHVSVGIDQIRVVGGIVFRSERFIFDTVDWIVMAGKHYKTINLSYVDQSSSLSSSSSSSLSPSSSSSSYLTVHEERPGMVLELELRRSVSPLVSVTWSCSSPELSSSSYQTVCREIW